jgi:hypothetical protein
MKFSWNLGTGYEKSNHEILVENGCKFGMKNPNQTK